MSLEQRIADLEKELAEIKANPRYHSFRASLIQIKFWDAEISAQPISIRDSTEEDTRLFDKVLKYQTDRQKILDSLDKDRNILAPEDIEKAEQESTSLVDDIRRRVKNEIRESDNN